MEGNSEDHKAVIDGPALRRMFEAATSVLERNTEAVNALNVFPVPDGDTGTNMLLTMRAVLAEMARAPDKAVGGVASAMAKGALLGARGNSGVILSQFFRGLARGLNGKAKASGADLAPAFEEGAAAAYKAVSKPVEGTMLTVMREAAEAARRAATASSKAETLAVLQAALKGSQDALARTPELLAVLKEAGVVDAGGQGFVVLLEGALRHLRGQEVESLVLEHITPLAGRVTQAFLTATEEEQYGYCTQFMVQGDGLDPDAIRLHLSKLAESTVVVGDSRTVKIHVHAFDPGPVISYGAALGTLAQVSIQNIDEQHQEFLAARRQEVRTASLAVVAVVWGGSLEAIFRNLGAAGLLQGGPTMNPSCQELLQAAGSVHAERVVLLPNNPNVIPTAKQASELSQKPIHVIPTRSIPQGIAAMLSFSPELELEPNLKAMERAAEGIRTGEVVTAVRAAQVSGRPIQAGQLMGFLEGQLVAVGDESGQVLADLVKEASAQEGTLVTLYWGADVTAGQAQADAARLRQLYPGVEMEAVHGGQPFYHYIISFE